MQGETAIADLKFKICLALNIIVLFYAFCLFAIVVMKSRFIHKSTLDLNGLLKCFSLPSIFIA
jgi:hypothetical protein